MKTKKLSITDVYQKVREEAERYYGKALTSKKAKQKEMYVNLANAYNLVSAWLEQTKEINPTK